MGCVHVGAETSVVLASNVQSLYNINGEGTLWRELHGSYVRQGELALAMVLFRGQVSSSCVWLEIDCLTNKGSKCDCLSCHEENIYGMSYFQICSNRLCYFTQHYRYHTIGDKVL